MIPTMCQKRFTSGYMSGCSKMKVPFVKLFNPWEAVRLDLRGDLPSVIQEHCAEKCSLKNRLQDDPECKFCINKAITHDLFKVELFLKGGE